MPTIEFLGYVAPRDPLINAHGNSLNWKDDNFHFSFTYTIIKSDVRIQCEVESVDDFNINYAHQISFIQVRGLLDAISFARGTGLRLIVDRCLTEEHGVRPVRSGSSILASLCPFSAQEIVQATEKERRLLKPLHDLTETLFDPLDAFVNAHRAIEGICRLLSDNKDRQKRWESLRENLNLTRPYLQFITDLSKDARHGDTAPVPMFKVGVVQTRAWTIFVRFLEFRKRGDIKLPLSEFPDL